jgi:hypothetical protein
MKVPRALGLTDLVLLKIVAIVAAFFPTADVKNVTVFETKIALGVLGPTAIGWFLYVRSRQGTD